MKKLSVIIPAYNEEYRIGKTLEAVSGFLRKQTYASEVLVVNDGSKDKTSQVVLGYAGQMPNLVLVDNQANHGKGWVTKQGMLKATGDACLFMDADNSTTIEQVSPMLPLLGQGYDVVIGSIEIQGAKVNENAQWYRRALGHWSKYLIRIVAGLWGIHDTQRGFKLFSGTAKQRIFSQLTVDRFGFDIEILAVAKKLGYKIKEVPVVWNNAGDSKVSLKSYISVLLDLFKIRYYLWTGKYK